MVIIVCQHSLAPRNSYIEYDPIVIAPTCVYLAAKVEECNTPAKVFDFGMRRIGI